MLDACDLLIIAGDLTARDTEREYDQLNRFLQSLEADKIVIIGGNHDNTLEINPSVLKNPKVSYLLDSGITYKGVSIWGSPWSIAFEGINPRCTAFTKPTDRDLAAHFGHIPLDTDILVTHTPPFGILDRNIDGICCGSAALRNVTAISKIKYHFFGHIHEGYGSADYGAIKYYNCSHMNKDYIARNSPVEVHYLKNPEVIL